MIEQHPDVSRIQAVIDECVPLLKKLARGRYAVSIGGSHGKRIFDERSDVDFRLFCDAPIDALRESEPWRSFCQVVERWRTQGIDIDYCWVRTIGAIDAQLDAWLSGRIAPEPIVWTLWGYQLLTDIANQMVIDDPAGVIAAWQARLHLYPQTLQRAIIKKHLGSLSYWRTDYHYRNKVERGDVVFLASIAARLVHDILQVLFALNKTYYVGDGNNLRYVAVFPIQPQAFAERVNAILYPPQTENVFAVQYETIIGLINDVMSLAAQTDAEGEINDL